MSLKQWFYWTSVVVSSVVVILNVQVLLLPIHNHDLHHSHSQQIKQDFVRHSSQKRVAPYSSYTTTKTTTIGHPKRSRTLLGIISADTRNDCSYRKRHRDLFQLWNDTRVCSLPELETMTTSQQQQRCQLVYTFVIGAGDLSDKTQPHPPPPMIVDNRTRLYRRTPLQSKFPDVNQDDVTRLNIR